MEKDMIKNPAHYTEGRKYEPKDVIRDWGLNFNLGNVVKYIARAGRKDELVQDLKKAQQYLQFEIDALEGEHKEKAPEGSEGEILRNTPEFWRLVKEQLSGHLNKVISDLETEMSEEPKSLSVNDLAGMTVEEFVRNVEDKKIKVGMTIPAGGSKRVYALDRVEYSPYLCYGASKVRLRLSELVFVGEDPKDVPGVVEIVLTHGRERKCEW